MSVSTKVLGKHVNLFPALRALTLIGALGILTACTGSSSVESPSNPIIDEPAAEDVVSLETKFDEKIITSGALSGLHIDAGAGAPIILIIPGSGPTDLNGNNPMGVTASTYRLLAEGLAERGVSTVRVDKRGMFSSEEAGDPNAVTVDIYANDYSAWVDTIRAQTNADCVYILGHSEGALMASAASALNENTCGQILVSGVGRSFGDVLREQLKANPANIIVMKDALAAIESLEAGETVDISDFNPALKPLFAPQVQGFLISLMQVNPAEMARAADTRTLVLHGTTDIQTSVEDAELLAKATGGELVLVEGVNHVLKTAPKNRGKNLRTYSDPNLPISPQVVEAIVGFVESEE